MSLGSVSGTVGTVVGLGVTLAALGLVVDLVDRSVDRATPRNGKARSSKRRPLFDVGMGSKKSGSSIFDIPKSSRSKSKNQNNMFGDFF